jgi:aspartate kinase
MTADPHLVGEAHTLDVVTYDEVTQLAYQGAKIIHPRALELAKQYNIPIKVRSTFSDGPGTLVTRGVYCPGKLQLMPDRLIAGIAHLPNIVQIRVEMPAADKKRETELFEILAKAGVSIDLINVFPRAKIFTITKNDLFAAQQALSEAKFEASITRELAKVSVVGAGMRGVPGVMATVVKVLNSAQVEILQTADSHATISCLVRGVDTQKALCALHEGFGLGKQ